MTQPTLSPDGRIDQREDRPVPSIDRADDPSLTRARRGALTLAHDRSSHRRFQALYDDLLS
ncbi:hypothetical protein [Jannaschia aquimarina]|uniref:Uncharacterized protein n=1 Tax=Jannaschia aquimarina TaxID=935700 RepID=A0A0D1EIZ5_9RHOB|nr:hypothetical protein [Jannaschia aquimarina]KIT16901.1 hypothetical protein jaqu_14000 [Jannaschia aquimarina]SNT11984.1 hypothetical protein SAMN05421775_10648 [Jannaschia aquimarina]